MRNALHAIPVLLISLTLAACGGGGGGGGGNGNGTNTPGPTPTVGPPVSGSALFVRTNGNDGSDGLSPATAKRTIDGALLALPALRMSKTVIVGPGSYTATLEDLPDGTRAQPVVLFADPSGESTSDAPGEVRLAGPTLDQSTVRLREAQWVTIDGFTIRGPSGANLSAVEIRNSADIILRNCEIFGGTDSADGVSLRDSNRVLLFNNLIIDNARRGVLVAGNGSGSSDITVVNNTIADNGEPRYRRRHLDHVVASDTAVQHHPGQRRRWNRRQHPLARGLQRRSEPGLPGGQCLLAERSRCRRRRQRRRAVRRAGQR